MFARRTEGFPSGGKLSRKRLMRGINLRPPKGLPIAGKNEPHSVSLQRICSHYLYYIKLYPEKQAFSGFSAAFSANIM